MATGKTQVLTGLSGQGLTNSFAYTAKYNTLGFSKVGVLIECYHLGSGVQYTIRGYPVEGVAKKMSLSSGTILTSGVSAYKTFSNPYQQIDVGLKAVQTAQSGLALVYVTGKRR